MRRSFTLAGTSIQREWGEKDRFRYVGAGSQLKNGNEENSIGRVF